MSERQDIRVSVKAIIVRDEKVLLIGYDLEDGCGFHYNLPGGGMKPGEGLHEALRREVREEAAAEVEVGPLLFVLEYVPAHHGNKYGSTQSLSLLFRCTLQVGSEPAQPLSPIDEQESTGDPANPFRCRDVFTAFAMGKSSSPLRIIFITRDDIVKGGPLRNREPVILGELSTGGVNLYTPRWAATLIRLGLKRGWQPDATSSPFAISNGTELLAELNYRAD